MTTIKMAALCTPNTYLRTLKPRRARHHAPTGLGRAQPTTLRLRHFPLCRRHFSSCGGREEGGSSAISCWCFVADPAGKASGLSARPFAKMPSSPLRVAVVCSSNQNRSMEAHNILSKRSFNVRSFGTGTHVKLPGPAPDKPNVYDFKTTYEQMYNDLLKKDKELYTQNGILHMLDRNKRIKPRPERFQNCKDFFDLVITCEERVYDQVVEDLNSREQETCQPVHVINVDIQDNHEEATLGAFLICELCQCIQHTEDMENEIDELLQEFEDKSGRTFLHTVCFY
uniref:RNA polymerase II subunit A C-terminal domain phosphatase SSU72 n=2 Tax=Pelobatoidea TaxID=8431 RepID=A0A8C5PYY7_9ANUR